MSWNQDSRSESIGSDARTPRRPNPRSAEFSATFKEDKHSDAGAADIPCCFIQVVSMLLPPPSGGSEWIPRCPPYRVEVDKT